MLPVSKARLQIHCCVALWGITAILGKLITLPALQLVWWRMLLVVGALLLVPKVWRTLAAMRWQLALAYAGIGVLVSIHWLTFYAAIKLANASVAATCIALAPVFLSLVEPWVARRPFDLHELMLGVAVVPGVALVAGGVPVAMLPGIGVGVVSALFVAFFSAFNKRLVDHANAYTVTFLELGAGVVFLGLLAPWMPGPAFVIPALHDALLLVLLAFGCTLLPFVLALVALRHLTAFGTQMVTNLEPVYAIALAIALLGEQRQLHASFYVGVAVILGAVFVHPWLTRVRKRAVAAEVLVASDGHGVVEENVRSA
jgi:drug/metabolite transporter (DMT)-like permease